MRPVVLLHGLGGSSAIWGPVRELLPPSLEVTAPDLPGGRAIEAEAAGVAEFAPEGRALIVGHSMGGLVATALAEQAPGCVASLLLVNTPPSRGSRLSARAFGEQVLKVPVAGRLLWKAAGERQLRAGLRTAVAPGQNVPDVLVDALADTSHDAFTGSTMSIDTYLQTPLRERLVAVGVTTEVLFGTADQRVDPGSLSEYDGVENVAVQTLEGIGHTPPLECPEQVAAAIVRAAAEAT